MCIPIILNNMSKSLEQQPFDYPSHLDNIVYYVCLKIIILKRILNLMVKRF